jgi:hypothetical protein
LKGKKRRSEAQGKYMGSNAKKQHISVSIYVLQSMCEENISQIKLSKISIAFIHTRIDFAGLNYYAIIFITALLFLTANHLNDTNKTVKAITNMCNYGQYTKKDQLWKIQ